MAIHELVPRYKIGPLRLREKLGQPLTPGDSVTARIDEHVFPDHRQWSGTGIVVTGVDSVILVHASDGSSYGYVQSDEKGLIRREEINNHPVTRGKIRWTENPTS